MKMKMKKVLFGTVILSLSIVCLMLNSCNKKSEEGKDVTFENIKVNKSIDIENSPNSPQCKVNIQMLYATNANGVVGQRINSVIIDKLFAMQKLTAKNAVDSFTNKYLDDYKTNYGPFYKEDKSNPEKKKTYQFYYNLSSEINKGKNGIVVYIIKENFYEGGAHGISQTIVLNFDNKTGKVLNINDIFVPGYENTLNGLLLDALLKKTDTKNVDELKTKGYLVSEDIYAPENFIIGDDGITFIYNPYEIAPYSIGKIEIKLENSDLSKILNKNFK